MDLIDILIAITLTIVSVLGIYLIKLVKRLFITIDIIENELKELDSKISPLISEFQEIANSGNAMATYAKEQADFANSLIESVKNKLSLFITKKEEDVTPKSNAHNLVTNLRAFFKGATTFINEIKK